MRPCCARWLEATSVELNGDQARQDFYDVLCVPQSGRYIPPYAHVLACGKVRNGDWWHFPPARFDGGDSLAGWYAVIGFDPMTIEADPMLRGPHRPLDQVGFVLAYLAALSANGETDTSSGDEFGESSLDVRGTEFERLAGSILQSSWRDAEPIFASGRRGGRRSGSDGSEHDILLSRQQAASAELHERGS